MLPFLMHRKQPGVVEVAGKVSHEEGEAPESMIAAAEDLLRAINMKDATAVAKAIQAAFELADSMPHVEGEHLGE